MYDLYIRVLTHFSRFESTKGTILECALVHWWLDIFQRLHMEMSLTLTLISGNWWIILHDNLRLAYV